MTNEPAVTSVTSTTVTRADTPVYSITELQRSCRQGEIISGLTHYEFDPVSGTVSTIEHPFSIVAAQDCDLVQDFDARENGQESDFSSALLYELTLVTDFRAATGQDGKVKVNSGLFKPIAKNASDRYHFLEAIPKELDLAGAGIADLVVDFKRYYTLPPTEILRQCAATEAVRRCRLETPYKEHLQLRMGFYHQRVALPLQHVVPRGLA